MRLKSLHVMLVAVGIIILGNVIARPFGLTLPTSPAFCKKLKSGDLGIAQFRHNPVK